MKTGTFLAIAPWLLGQAFAAPLASPVSSRGDGESKNVLTGDDLAKLGVDIKGMDEQTLKKAFEHMDDLQRTNAHVTIPLSRRDDEMKNLLSGVDLAKLGLDLKDETLRKAFETMGALQDTSSDATAPLPSRRDLEGLSSVLALIRPILDGIELGGDDAFSATETTSDAETTPGTEIESALTTPETEPSQVSDGVVDGIVDRVGALSSGSKRGLPLNELLNKVVDIDTGKQEPDTATDSSEIIDVLGSNAADMVRQAVSKVAGTVGLGKRELPLDGALDGVLDEVLDKVGPLNAVKAMMKTADTMVGGAASTFVKSVGDATGDAVEQAVDGIGEFGGLGESAKA